MIVTSREAAWAEVDKIFPTDYEKDYDSSARAGYDVYRHWSLNWYCRICDLGDRLEVLTGEYGENVTNIWIRPEPKEEFEAEVIARGSYIDTPYGKNDDKFIVETFTLRLNPAALSEYHFSRMFSPRECYDDGEAGDKEYEEHKALYAERFRKWEGKILEVCGLSTSDPARITQAQAEVFTVVQISKVEGR